MTFRAGIIGAGNIAWRYDQGVSTDNQPTVTIASCLDRHPDTQLVAIYDPIDEARQSFKKEYQGLHPVTIHDTLQSFFDQQLDLVAIASPSKYHAEQIEACLEQSIPLLWVEKPVTLDMPSYDRLLTIYSNLELQPRVCVNYQRRCTPQLSYMQQHLASSASEGLTTSVTINYSRGLDVNGVHLLDLLGALTDAHEVPPLDYLRSSDRENPQFGLTLNNISVSVIGHTLPYHLIELVITDTRGRLSLIRGAKDLIWEPAIPNPDYPGFSMLHSPSPEGDVHLFHEATQNATYRMLCTLLDINEPLSSTLQSAWFSQALLGRVVDEIGMMP